MKAAYSDTKVIKKCNITTDTPIYNEKHTELYDELQAGINDIVLNNTRPFDKAMAAVKVKRSK